MRLQDFFGQYPKAALAFSGGVDSAYLLYAGLAAGTELRPYYVKTQFQPDFEYRDAMRLCRELGVEPVVLSLDALTDPQVRANGPERCYFCKTRIMSAVIDRAALDGFTVLLDGTNASDDSGDRPGMRALGELGILSPLRLCGLTKPEIRRLSRKAGLFTWDKPAYACLATRVPTGTPLSAGLLGRIEGAEAALFRLGFSDFRCRVFNDAARLQFHKDQYDRAAAMRTDIRDALRPFFDVILMDTEVRG